MDHETKDAALEGGTSILDMAELAMGDIPLLGSIMHGGLAGKAQIESWTTSDPANKRALSDEAKFQVSEMPPGIGPLVGTAREQQVRAAIRAGDDPLPEPTYTESGPDMERELREAKHRVEIPKIHGHCPDPGDLAHMRQLEREMGDPDGRIKDGVCKEHDYDDVDALYALQQYKFQAELDEQAKTGAYTKEGYAKPLDHPNLGKAIDDSESTSGWAMAKGYQIASPFLSMFGVHPPSDDALRAREEDSHTYHYGK